MDINLVFADSSYYVALMSRIDENHARAIAWQQYLVTRSIKTVTTDAVWWELLNAFAAPTSRRAIFTAYRSIFADPNVSVIGFEQQRIAQAMELYRSRSDKAWSIVDCYSFVLMEARSITAALTADHHFEQAGHKALLMRDP